VDAHQLLPADHADWIDGLVFEALRIKAAGHRRGLIRARLLGEKADVRRTGSGVRWERYRAGGERRLQGHIDDVNALAECEGRMCSGSRDGSIRVWGGATLEHERTLRDEENEEDSVMSLAAWEGQLISGHGSGVIRVWNVATGVRDRVLEGHTDAVNYLAVSGTRLVSGSDDRSVKVWAMRAGASWPCERTLEYDGMLFTMATWRDKVLGGFDDASVRVWDIGTGALDATLDGHERAVTCLAVHGDRLFSAAFDGTIREWSLGTWAAVRTVEAYGQEGRQYPYCLAVSGSQLVSGSADRCVDVAAEKLEVRVWDLGTLECEHTLPQPGESEVWCLAAGCGAVWGGVGNEAVVWGRA
jgi:WD40 repeat protein